MRRMAAASRRTSEVAMRFRFFTIISVAAAAGCAGGAQATPGDGVGRLTVVVTNEFASAVTVYAVWPGGRRNRLGEVQPDRTRTFEPQRAGDEIALGLELASAPPVGTTAG